MDPRSVVALLVNDETRRMLALVELGQLPESPTKREARALERLISAGIVTPGHRIDTAALRSAVESYSPAKPEGVERFIRDGRIVNYPAAHADRVDVLRWVGERVIAPGERLTESEINERLHPYMEEHVLLRRYLVDYGVVVRNADGTGYERA